MTNTTKFSGPVLTSLDRRKDGSVYGMTVETLDFSLKLTFRSWGSSTYRVSTREYFAKTRVYGALPEFVPGFDAEETRLFAAIPDHSVKDPALARFQRASVKTAKAGLLELLPQLVAALVAAGHRVSYVPTNAKFSKYAGCSMCACSPGFVLDERLVVDGKGVDLFF